MKRAAGTIFKEYLEYLQDCDFTEYISQEITNRKKKVATMSQEITSTSSEMEMQYGHGQPPITESQLDKLIPTSIQTSFDVSIFKFKLSSSNSFNFIIYFFKKKESHISVYWVEKPFKLLVLERKYSTPQIPKSWTRKISLTVAEVKTLIKNYSAMEQNLIEKRDKIIEIGVEFLPIREILTLSKNHYIVLTMLGDESKSLMITNHWSWVRDNNQKDEYATSLFVPALFSDSLMDQIALKMYESDKN